LELEFFPGAILLVGKKQIIKSTLLISKMEHLFEVECAVKPGVFFVVAGFGSYITIS